MNISYQSQTDLQLNEEEIKRLINIISQFNYNPSDYPELFCKESKKLANLLPKRIKQKLTNFLKNYCDNGFLLVKTVPTYDIEFEKTPASNNLKIGEKTMLAKIQSLFIHFIGDMIAYEAEGFGRLFQDIVPLKTMENVQTSLGSNTELEIHTEQAFSKLRPDILTLGCLRGDENAYTYILPVNKIIENVSEEEVEMLRQPLWKTGIDTSFKLNGNEFIDGDIRGPFSILNGSEKDPFLIFDQDLMFGITEEANNIIKKIVTIYYNHRIKINLQPGDIIILDNNRVVHGRSSFIAKYDGTDRFLVRCFATLNYAKSKYARPNDSRVISAIYS